MFLLRNPVLVRRLLATVLLASTSWLLPLLATAHATPVQYIPAADTELTEPPEEVAIRFSERPEPDLSQLRVFSPEGQAVYTSEAAVDVDDTWRLFVPIEAAVEGRYIVEWSVVSADDGHFTRGTHSFVVGSERDAAALASETLHHTEVEHVTSSLEVILSTLELYGNGVVWGVLVFLLLVYRPARANLPETTRQRIDRLLRGLLLVTLFAVSVTVLGYILLKGSELAAWQGWILAEGIARYLGSGLGENILWRLGLILAAGSVLFFGWCRFFTAYGNWWIAGVATLLLGFAYVRSLLSHATADPFYPQFSTFVNVMHMVEKDLWAGLLTVLLLVSCLAAGRSLIAQVYPRLQTFLSLNLVFLSLTASYIIWLQLKDISFLTTTLWGGYVQLLVAAAMVLVSIRMLHIWLAIYRPRWLAERLPFWQALELAPAVAVLYLSSLVILVSPPPLLPATQAQSVMVDDVVVTLAEHQIEQNTLQLIVDTDSTELTARITSVSNDRLSDWLQLEKRTDKEYTFTRADLLGEPPWELEVFLTRTDGYDLQPTFVLDAKWQTKSTLVSHGRSFDTYTIFSIILALVAVFALGLVVYFTRLVQPLIMPREPAGSLTEIFPGLVIGTSAVLFVLIVVNAVFGVPFYDLCLAAGDEWHVMQPMRDGVLLAEKSFEGCMTSDHQNHFVDFAEYKMFRGLP